MSDSETIRYRAGHDSAFAAVDLLDAIREDREPEAGMFASRRVVEMTASVYSSALTGERVSLPLTSRENPLA